VDEAVIVTCRLLCGEDQWGWHLPRLASAQGLLRREEEQIGVSVIELIFSRAVLCEEDHGSSSPLVVLEAPAATVTRC
jgi:hypothetical protein